MTTKYKSYVGYPTIFSKEEPDIVYIYKIIKQGEGMLPIGNLVHSFSSEMDSEYYKLVATSRLSFVGNMQEEINIAMKGDMMKQYVMEPIFPYLKRKYREWKKNREYQKKHSDKKTRKYFKDIFNKEEEETFFFEDTFGNHQ